MESKQMNAIKEVKPKYDTPPAGYSGIFLAFDDERDRIRAWFSGEQFYLFDIKANKPLLRYVSSDFNYIISICTSTGELTLVGNHHSTQYKDDQLNFHGEIDGEIYLRNYNSDGILVQLYPTK
jgi:hypothetical protein